MLGLNIFRLHDVSFGLTASGISSKHEVEVVEDRFHNGYYRLVVANGFLVGMQAVGMTRGVGHFLSAMGRRVKLGELREELNSALLACQPLWRYKVGLKLGRSGAS